MPSKRKATKGKRKQPSRGRRKAASRGLHKSQVAAVKGIVNVMLDHRIEDKYLIQNMASWTQLRAGGIGDDNVNKCFIQEITPGFPRGTGESNRIANKIYLKFMSIQLRMHPSQTNQLVTAGATNTSNIVFPNEPIKCVLCRTPNVGGYTASEFLAKYRRTGLWPQELSQVTAAQEVKPVLTTLKKFSMVRKHRTVFNGFNSEDGGGVPFAQVMVYNVPQTTFHEQSVTFKKNLLLEDATGYPLHHKYYLFIQYCSKWRQDYGLYDDLVMPSVDIRTRWVYEDA